MLARHQDCGLSDRTEAGMAQSAAPHQFVGTWKLVAMRARRGDGSQSEPYGPEPLGYITYTADGHMHAILMDPDAPATAAVEVPGKALAYAATWEVRGTDVVHHVAAGLPTQWTGTDLVRTYAFEGDRMTLTAFSPGDRSVTLVWQRTESAPQP
jgi:hypothetical protein